VAIIQILVYVGAISVVIIFAIMLTEVQTGRLELFFNRQTAVAALAALVGAAVLAIVSLSADIGQIGDESLTPGLRQLSKLIFDRYVFPFELVSLVLVAAMIGAIVLATRERERS
jgi:NADH-quinone oxidoreductase subunit J